MPRISPTVLLGKTIRKVARLRGGGSAFPGLVVERLQPDFLRSALGQLHEGVVIITGTNGKTTTTKMVTELLRASGLRVLTNRTGSNFTRGIVAMVLEHMTFDGRLDYDIAVIELDEAYAKRFVQKVTPAYVVALNVMRDQLDRFGEIDTVAKLLEPVLASATHCVVINNDDPLLRPIGQALLHKKKKVHFFGVSTKLKDYFPTDDELQARTKTARSSSPHENAVELATISGQTVGYKIAGKPAQAELKLQGSYNFQNAAAALALARAVRPQLTAQTLVRELAAITPAFGRGEKITVNGQPVELVLVKNPAGFRLSLGSFVKPGQEYMIAINDAYADGRDMSWLWDVEFDGLREQGVAMVTGRRAYDMALRLQYDEVLFSLVEPSITKAVRHFILASQPVPKVIFCTYTAMLTIRKELKKYTGELEVGL